MIINFIVQEIPTAPKKRAMWQGPSFGNELKMKPVSWDRGISFQSRWEIGAFNSRKTDLGPMFTLIASIRLKGCWNHHHLGYEFAEGLYSIHENLVSKCGRIASQCCSWWSLKKVHHSHLAIYRTLCSAVIPSNIPWCLQSAEIARWILTFCPEMKLFLLKTIRYLVAIARIVVAV